MLQQTARRLLIVAAAAGLLLPLTAIPVSAAPQASCPADLTAAAHVTPDGGTPFTVCTGRVPSFDGTPLDVDVSMPDSASGPVPLVVMMHGWGNQKTDFESGSLTGNGTNTWHWNNAWFTDRGYAVLTYTSRGFHRSCGLDPATGYGYATDPECAGKASWTHLADRRWEIRDTQYLVGRLVDDGTARADAVVVTGDSYGGGQSWLLALAQDQVLHADGTTTSWTSPSGVPIRLAAAVPQYGWTDLGQSLVDNGHASSHDDPVGVEKQSYVTGLYSSGETSAQYAVPRADPTADLRGWFAALSAGEPYAADPLVGEALRQLRDYRSPYAMPVPPPGRQVPVFAIQGLTDPLFPAVQLVQEDQRLRATYPDYPVWAFLGDLGHPYADNPQSTWQLANNAANAWLSLVLAGSRPSQPRYTVTTVPCRADQSVRAFSADTLDTVATGALHLSSAATARTTSAAAPGPEAVRTDPVVNGGAPGTTGGCPTMSAQTDPGVAAWTFHPSAATLVGAPVVRVRVAMTGTDAELSARLWDVDPDTGQQALVTRAVYRLTDTSPTSVHDIAVRLWPTAWQLRPGHRLKLELTQVDAPTWRADNLPSGLTLSRLRLSVPTRTS